MRERNGHILKHPAWLSRVRSAPYSSASILATREAHRGPHSDACRPSASPTRPRFSQLALRFHGSVEHIATCVPRDCGGGGRRERSSNCTRCGPRARKSHTLPLFCAFRLPFPFLPLPSLFAGASHPCVQREAWRSRDRTAPLASGCGRGPTKEEVRTTQGDGGRADRPESRPSGHGWGRRVCAQRGLLHPPSGVSGSAQRCTF